MVKTFVTQRQGGCLEVHHACRTVRSSVRGPSKLQAAVAMARGLASLVLLVSLADSGGFAWPGFVSPPLAPRASENLHVARQGVVGRGFGACFRQAVRGGRVDPGWRAPVRDSGGSGALRSRENGVLRMTAREDMAILTEVVVEPSLFSDAEMRKYAGMDRACRVLRKDLPAILTRSPNADIYAAGVTLRGEPLGGQLAGSRDDYLGMVDGILGLQSLGGGAALRVQNVSVKVEARTAYMLPGYPAADVPPPPVNLTPCQHLQVEARTAYMPDAAAADEVLAVISFTLHLRAAPPRYLAFRQLSGFALGSVLRICPCSCREGGGVRAVAERWSQIENAVQAAGAAAGGGGAPEAAWRHVRHGPPCARRPRGNVSI